MKSWAFWHRALAGSLLALLLGGRAQAQAPGTLLWERLLLNRYAFGACSFELPGHRLIHIGTEELWDAPTVTSHRQIMFSITTTQGDTVRFMRPRPTPLNRSEGVGGVVMTADYHLVVVAAQWNSAMPSLGQVAYLAEFDTLGRTLWQRPFSTAVSRGGAYGLLAVGDGYLMLQDFTRQVGGANFGYAGLLKTDKQGNVLWQRTYNSRGLQGSGGLYDLIASPDGSYLAAGICDQGGPYTGGAGSPRQDFWLLKLRPNGDTIAQAHFGRPNVFEQATRLCLLPDGGLVLSGERTTRLYDNSPCLVRLDSLWQPQWEFIDPLFGYVESFPIVQATTAGHLLVGGVLPALTGGGVDAFLMSLDGNSGTGVHWLRRRPGLAALQRFSQCGVHGRGHSLPERPC